MLLVQFVMFSSCCMARVDVPSQNGKRGNVDMSQTPRKEAVQPVVDVTVRYQVQRALVAR